MSETNTPADEDAATREKEAAAAKAVAANAETDAAKTDAAETDAAETNAAETNAAETDTEVADAADGDRDAGRIDVEAAKYRAYFTRRATADETGALTEERYVFARWGGPVAPVVLGLDPESEERMLSGVAFAAEVAGAPMAPPDGQTTPNLVMLFAESWPALKETPGLSRLVPDIERLSTLLAAVGANRYRFYTFSPEDGITLCVSLHVVDAAVADTAAADFALAEAAQCLLLWSDSAFSNESPLGRRRGRKPMLKRRVANLLRAAYAEDALVYADDPAHALALATSAEDLAERRRSERADSRQADSRQEDAPQERDEGADADAGGVAGAGDASDESRDTESIAAHAGSEGPGGAESDPALPSSPDDAAAAASDAGAEPPDAAKDR